MTETIRTPTERKTVPFGTLITVGTATLYAYSYAFERGYAFQFGYPSGLIGMNIGMIMNFGAGLFLYSLLIFGFCQLALQYWPNTKKHVFRLVVVFIIFFAAAIVAKGWFPSFARYSYGLVSITILLSILVLKYWEKRDKPDDLDKVPMAYDARSNIDKRSIAYAMVQRLGFDPLLLAVLFVAILPALFWLAGIADARARLTHHYYSENGVDYVVLNYAGMHVIAGRLNREDRGYYPEYVVRPVTAIGSLVPLDRSPLVKIDAGISDVASKSE